MKHSHPEAHWMAVRWVRFLTNTDAKYTVVSQLRERGKCILQWYIDFDDLLPGANGDDRY